MKPSLRYAEIVPKNGSHQIVVDGKEWSRHDDVKTAEQVCSQIVADFAEELERNTERLLAAMSEPGPA